jgi:hypothetical protein
MFAFAAKILAFAAPVFGVAIGLHSGEDGGLFLSPLAYFLCAFALTAVLAAGLRAQVRRSARREAWHMIAEDRASTRRHAGGIAVRYSDTVARQAYGV